MSFNPWQLGDKVRFAHQKQGEGKFTVIAVSNPTWGPMVELKELPGEFAAHLFVAAEDPSCQEKCADHEPALGHSHIRGYNFSIRMGGGANSVSPERTEGTMSKPTPGPWQLAGYAQGGRFVGQAPDGILGVALAFGDTTVEQDTNAKLIAAAPELLEALKLAVPIILSALAFVDCNAQLRLARAAIEKAEGRP